MRTIAIVNQKGGCGKTTTAINLAAEYARRGLRTLLVDIDPQSHCAAGLGVPEHRIEYSIGDAMLSDLSQPFDRAKLVWEVARNLDLAPSTMLLARMEAPGGGLHELPDRDRRLETLLKHLAPAYDRCLIDCPPTIGLLTFNALRAARETLIPVETGYFALRGAEKQWETIQRVISRINRPIACHILPTLYDPQSELAQDILGALRRQFAGQILPIVIRNRPELRTAASLGQAVLEHAADSEGAADYARLADWLMDHQLKPVLEIEVVRDPDRAEGRMGSPGPWTGPIAPTGATSGPAAGMAAGMAAPDAPDDLDGTRAGELAHRLRQLTLRATATATATATPGATPPSISAAMPLSIAPSVEASAGRATVREMPTHVYGARVTTRGVLFVQPNDGSRRLAIAGDFNHWTPLPLEHQPELGLSQVTVRMSPGRHQYRLVADGQWMADPYNERRALNPHGEANSVLEVPVSQAAS